MPRKRRATTQVVLSPESPLLSEFEQRLILETADAMVYGAGRSTLVLALRGSKNKKLDKFQADTLPGFGYYREMPEKEVLARVDQLIHQELLRIDTSHDGFPLLAYTPKGLELAEQWGAERWLTELREHFKDPIPYIPSFAHERMPNRNLKTLGHLLEVLQISADIEWLPFLRQWRERETARIRKRLDPIIANLK